MSDGLDIAELDALLEDLGPAPATTVWMPQDVYDYLRSVARPLTHRGRLFGGMTELRWQLEIGSILVLASEFIEDRLIWLDADGQIVAVHALERDVAIPCA